MSFFEKRQDQKQILADQERSVGIAPEEPVVSVPAVPVPVAPEPVESSRSQTASHNVSIHATKKRTLKKKTFCTGLDRQDIFIFVIK